MSIASGASGASRISGLSKHVPLGKGGSSRSVQFSVPDAVGCDTPISVDLVTSGALRHSARNLINRMYDWRGYGNEHQIPVAPTHYTFTASDCDDVVGTITLTVDSSSGLAADKIFKNEIDEFRNSPGAVVCELTKLAFDSDKPSKELLAKLFHIVFIFGYRQNRCTDLFIEVNPRHRRFYELMLGFKRVGELKTNQSVAAPSQLMWLQVSAIRDQINLSAQIAGPRAKTLYSLFFSPAEENSIYDRLTSGIDFAGRGKDFSRPDAASSCQKEERQQAAYSNAAGALS